jgi:hypothetical protein
MKDEDVVITNPGSSQDVLTNKKLEELEQHHEHPTPPPNIWQQSVNRIHSFWEVHNAEEGTMLKVTKDGTHHWEQESTKEVDVGTLRGKMFISNPDIEGDQYQTTIDDVRPTGQFTADQRQVLYQFKCNHRGKDFEEILTYNQMMDWCSSDVTEEGEFQLEGMLGHQKKAGTGAWQGLIDWANGSQTWEDMRIIQGGNEVTLSLYAKKSGIS